ncbi:MAG: hypothetical protein V7L05_31270 [Nostoc sp.]
MAKAHDQERRVLIITHRIQLGEARIMRSLLELLHHHAWELVAGVTGEC